MLLLRPSLAGMLAAALLLHVVASKTIFGDDTDVYVSPSPASEPRFSTKTSAFSFSLSLLPSPLRLCRRVATATHDAHSRAARNEG